MSGIFDLKKLLIFFFLLTLRMKTYSRQAEADEADQQDLRPRMGIKAHDARLRLRESLLNSVMADVRLVGDLLIIHGFVRFFFLFKELKSSIPPLARLIRDRTRLNEPQRCEEKKKNLFKSGGGTGMEIVSQTSALHAPLRRSSAWVCGEHGVSN